MTNDLDARFAALRAEGRARSLASWLEIIARWMGIAVLSAIVLGGALNESAPDQSISAEAGE